jgi:uncharacterized protein YndB with AHSA1/START domain
MTDENTDAQKMGIELEYELDEPPQKVWRAISIPELRSSWLPPEDLADPEAISVTPGEEVRYRLRDSTPPFLESTVTFRITPNAIGGTLLRIIHEHPDASFERMASSAVNNNGSPVMLAA